MTDEALAAELARQLEQAWVTRRPIAPLSETHGITTPARAYPVARAWNALRVAQGERVVGRKLGLTNRLIQERFGTTTPDHGYLWASRHFPATGGRASAPAGLFIEPVVEGEIAFLLERELAGPGVTTADVLAATAALAPALELVDSRVGLQRARLGDTIADNASFGGFTHGVWDARLREVDLRTLGMLVEQNGVVAIEGIGAATLGHPAAAVAWLVNELATTGEALAPGAIVLSGSLGRVVPVRAGDVLTMHLHGQPPLTLTLTS